MMSGFTSTKNHHHRKPGAREGDQIRIQRAKGAIPGAARHKGKSQMANGTVRQGDKQRATIANSRVMRWPCLGCAVWRNTQQKAAARASYRWMKIWKLNTSQNRDTVRVPCGCLGVLIGEKARRSFGPTAASAYQSVKLFQTP